MSNPALIQDEQHQRLEVKLRRELGDQVLRLLDDNLTEDILLNPNGSLWVKRMGESFSRMGEMPAAQAASALGTIAAWRGTVLNHEHPILETELPIDGSRFEGIVSPVVRRPVFAIRLRPRKIFSLDDYESDGILTDGTDPLNQLRRRDDFLDGVRGLKHGDVIGLIGIAIAGGAMLWGGELTEFGRRACMIGLVVSVLVFAAPLLASAFGVNAAVV